MYFPLEFCIGKLLCSAAGIERGGLHQGALAALLRIRASHHALHLHLCKGQLNHYLT